MGISRLNRASSALRTASVRSLSPFSLVPLHPYSNSNGDPEQRPTGRSHWSEQKKTESEEQNKPKHTDELLKAHIEQLKQLRSSTRVMESKLSDPLAKWARALSDRFGFWFQGIVADVLTAKVDSQFDLQDWLEGAKDAFWMVHKLIADEDYGTLRTMASSKLVDAIEATGKEYRSAGLVWRTEIDTDKPIDAQLRYFTTWDRRTIENYDEDKVGSSVPTGPYPTGQWLVFWIQFKAGQQTVVTREEDGSVVARIVDDRPSLWTFACGPLPPDLPVRQLDTPLWLLKFN